MNNTAKTIIGIIIAVLVIWGIASISNSPVEEESGSIQIGFIGPLTGDAAAYGEPLRNVIQLAVDEINEQGGIKGKDLEVIYEDGMCTGKEATSAMQRKQQVPCKSL